MEIMVKSGQLELETCDVSPKYNHLNLNQYEKMHVNSIIEPSVNNTTFDAIIGHTDLKLKIVENIFKPLQNLDMYKETALLDPPNGIIMYGPPGTGKTMMARAIAKTIQCPFIVFSIHNIENKMFGESAKILNGLFSLAKKLRPCVVFIDELDGFFGHRNAFDQSFVTGLKTQMLQHMDGIDKRTSDIIVIGATNLIENIDKAVKRRMRLHIKIDLPDDETRKLMFTHHLKDMNLDCEKFVEKSRGLSGSDILEVCKAAAHNAVIKYDDYKKLDYNTLLHTLDDFCKT
jgi:SpoVK/Ycf46/Vps4 family AAA+-type ATPase